MSKILDSIDQTTSLVGKNRLQMLLFGVGTDQYFGINVFKVKEIIKVPAISFIPSCHKHIIGEVVIRDMTMPVIDLKAAIGFKACEITEKSNLIITEYNLSTQAFLVNDVKNIINLNWSDVSSPPKLTGNNHYLNAITQINDGTQTKIVSIIDVEKILDEVINLESELEESIIKPELESYLIDQHVLIVDDSVTARNQIKKILLPLGIKVSEATNGLEGLKLLKFWADNKKISKKDLLMIIVDAEMPEMDGYKLTYELRQDKRFDDSFIVLHTSLSGRFNLALAEKVGYDLFMPKFQPNEFLKLIQSKIKENL